MEEAIVPGGLADRERCDVLFGGDEQCDVLVVGGGAAGLMAALVARTAGAHVILLEKAAKLGGTAAISGGVVWAPGNDHVPGGDRRENRSRPRAGEQPFLCSFLPIMVGKKKLQFTCSRPLKEAGRGEGTIRPMA